MVTPTAVIILAAGKGTRMKSALPKVMHKMADLPMLGHVVQAAQAIHPQKIVTIIGHEAEQVKTFLGQWNECSTALQAEQLGTGHAAQQAEEQLADFQGDIVILCGDCPLVTPALMQGLLAKHQTNEAVLTVLTTDVQNPTGLGRIVRDGSNNFTAIVEEKDATDTQRQIREINTAIYAVKASHLFSLLKQVKNNNAQNEYYLTTIAGLAIEQGLNVATHHVADGEALMGVNSPLQLAECEGIYQQRRRREALDSGVKMLDPQTVYFAHDTLIAPGCEVGPQVVFGAGVRIEGNSVIEGHCHISRSHIHGNVRIRAFSYIEGSAIHNGAQVGPFARLRDGTVLHDNVHVGHFVEVKNSTLGEGAKANHLTYLGDATIGARTNIGAGTITCNYDGINKHRTTVGADSFIGSNSSLIAPVNVGDHAYVAAGSVITKNIPEGALGITRAQQVNKDGYSERRKKLIKKGA